MYLLMVDSQKIAVYKLKIPLKTVQQCTHGRQN